MTWRRKLLVLAAAVLTGAACFSAGFFVSESRVGDIVERQYLPQSVAGAAGRPFQFINPLLECSDATATPLWSRVALRARIAAAIEQAVDRGDAELVSVYVRELNDGPWLGIGQDENYAPASLLKVPIMVAVLKEVERNPGFLRQPVAYEQRMDTSYAPVFSDSRIEPGRAYTIEELLTAMIRHSDNEAQHLLVAIVGRTSVVEVLQEMGIADRNDDFYSDFLTVREYASVFRLLYNATYLSRTYSEYALQLLSGSTYSGGLRAGLPPGVTTASKFGERGTADSSLRQLHDCGIVYSADSPYLLCVMTKGRDFAKLATVIANISRLVFAAVGEGRS